MNPAGVAAASPVRLFLRRTKAKIRAECDKNRHITFRIGWNIRGFPAEKYFFTLARKARLHHIVAARYCGFVREAAALPGRFLPELGRFGNEAAFFFSGFFSGASLYCLDVVAPPPSR